MTMTTTNDPVMIEGLETPIPAWLAVLPFSNDDEGIADAIAERHLEATTVDELLKGSDTSAIEGLVGKHLVIRSVRLQASTLETGIGVYVAIDFTNAETGEQSVTTTSAKSVMAQLATAHVRGWFPLECTIAEVDTGKNGRSNPLHLSKWVGEPF